MCTNPTQEGVIKALRKILQADAKLVDHGVAWLRGLENGDWLEGEANRLDKDEQPEPRERHIAIMAAFGYLLRRDPTLPVSTAEAERFAVTVLLALDPHAVDLPIEYARGMHWDALAAEDLLTDAHSRNLRGLFLWALGSLTHRGDQDPATLVARFVSLGQRITEELAARGGKQAEAEKYKLTKVDREVLQALRKAGRRLIQRELAQKAFGTDITGPMGKRFARLVREGVITSHAKSDPGDGRGTGYGLPEWLKEADGSA